MSCSHHIDSKVDTSGRHKRRHIPRSATRRGREDPCDRNPIHMDHNTGGGGHWRRHTQMRSNWGHQEGLCQKGLFAAAEDRLALCAAARSTLPAHFFGLHVHAIFHPLRPTTGMTGVPRCKLCTREDPFNDEKGTAAQSCAAWPQPNRTSAGPHTAATSDLHCPRGPRGLGCWTCLEMATGFWQPAKCPTPAVQPKAAEWLRIALFGLPEGQSTATLAWGIHVLGARIHASLEGLGADVARLMGCEAHMRGVGWVGTGL